MMIVKSNNYIVGVSSITELVGTADKLKFDEGEPIEVSNEQFEAINALGWCEEIKEEHNVS